MDIENSMRRPQIGKRPNKKNKSWKEVLGTVAGGNDQYDVESEYIDNGWTLFTKPLSTCGRRTDGNGTYYVNESLVPTRLWANIQWVGPNILCKQITIAELPDSATLIKYVKGSWTGIYLENAIAIENEASDPNGGNVCLFSAATCTSQCKWRTWAIGRASIYNDGRNLNREITGSIQSAAVRKLDKSRLHHFAWVTHIKNKSIYILSLCHMHWQIPYMRHV